jgi:hypothetical protein
MGRHSSPEEGDPPVAVPVVRVAAPTRPRPEPPRRGRHAAPGDDDPDELLYASAIAVLDTEPVPTLDEASDVVGAGVEIAEPETTVDGTAEAVGETPLVAAPKARKASGTAQDLHLLRNHPALRNRVIAATVLPFALLAVALLFVGRIQSYVSWVWVPLIVAGVLAGVLLDLEHRRVTADPLTASSADDEAVGSGAVGVEHGAQVPDTGGVAGPQGAAEVGVVEGPGQIDQP